MLEEHQVGAQMLVEDTLEEVALALQCDRPNETDEKVLKVAMRLFLAKKKKCFLPLLADEVAAWRLVLLDFS
jgi:hypothetical protein